MSEQDKFISELMKLYDGYQYDAGPILAICAIIDGRQGLAGYKLIPIGSKDNIAGSLYVEMSAALERRRIVDFKRRLSEIIFYP